MIYDKQTIRTHVSISGTISISCRISIFSRKCTHFVSHGYVYQPVKRRRQQGHDQMR